MEKNEMPETCVVMITCGSEDEAHRIGRELVEERLTACASVEGPIESIYWWKGDLEENTETKLVLKTRRSHVERIAKRVEELHSYELPQVVALPIQAGLEPYIRWIEEETAEAD